MRPTVRMAALMGIGSVFVYTHDSVFVGEDGPTHEPIEQTMSLRLIPNVSVFRPADALETAVAWKAACENRKQPTCLLLTRQGLPVLHDYAKTIAKGAPKGAYVLSPSSKDKVKAVLLATGSEVHLALDAQKALEEKGNRCQCGVHAQLGCVRTAEQRLQEESPAQGCSGHCTGSRCPHRLGPVYRQ